jgi:hypothetical protein
MPSNVENGGVGSTFLKEAGVEDEGEDWLQSDEEAQHTYKSNDYDMASKDTSKIQSKLYDVSVT